MTVDLAELRRLAAQATPGPWAWEQVRKFRDGAYGDNWVALDRNHKFIAACDPGTVLALVEAVKALEMVVNRMEAGDDDLALEIGRAALVPFVEAR